jgi:cytochrome c peroxidase
VGFLIVLHELVTIQGALRKMRESWHMPKPKMNGFGLLMVVAAISLGMLSKGAAESGNLKTISSEVDLAEQLLTHWSTEYSEVDLTNTVSIPLRFSRALSAHFTEANGVAEIHLDTGEVQVDVEGLEAPSMGHYEVWLIENIPGAPMGAALDLDEDIIIHVGPLSPTGSLQTTLAPETLAGIEIDLAAVMHIAPNQEPEIVIVGMQSIVFEMSRLAKSTAGPLETANILAHKIKSGRELFTEETFDGNGRTCATCHIPNRGFTITPGIIRQLPQSDPLFVFKTNKELAKLEDERLLKKRALFLENIQGFKKRPFFRGSPSVENAAETAPFGYSGNIGDLQTFSMGAIEQHFPRTLKREKNVDFRVPTKEELKAIEAFQLSVAFPRNKNFNLDSLVKTEQEKRGRDLFFGEGRCGAFCHVGPVLGNSNNFDTGVVDQPINKRDRLPLDTGGPGGFSTPQLFGIARTGPFFHDNSVNTLEEAVAFYTTSAFANSPNGQVIQLEPDEIKDIVAFLKAISR